MRRGGSQARSAAALPTLRGFGGAYSESLFLKLRLWHPVDREPTDRKSVRSRELPTRGDDHGNSENPCACL